MGGFDLPATIGTSRGVSVEGASASLLRELLRELEREVRRHGVPLDRFLRPGAASEDIVACFASAGLTPLALPIDVFCLRAFGLYLAPN